MKVKDVVGNAEGSHDGTWCSVSEGDSEGANNGDKDIG